MRMPWDYLLAAALILGVNFCQRLARRPGQCSCFCDSIRVWRPFRSCYSGALAAGLGRFTLSTAARQARKHMSRRRLESLASAQAVLAGSRRKAAAGLALFALSPLPSAQLFVAAGLMTVPLVPLTGAFFAGRLVSYSIYVAGASAAKERSRMHRDPCANRAGNYVDLRVVSRMPLDYLLAGAAVFGVNLLPAFGPSIWAVLVFLRLNSDLAAVPLVLVGALAAALGRFTLATASRHLRRFMSQERLESLEAAQGVLSGSRRRAFAGLALFALSPVPSASCSSRAGS